MHWCDGGAKQTRNEVKHVSKRHTQRRVPGPPRGVMKLKVVHRDPDEFDPERKRKSAIYRRYRNADPRLQPLERAREIQRAIVATKMEKMFAKPLVGVLDGHRDSVRCMARCHSRLTDLFTGSCDGEIRHWNTAKKCCLRSIRAHEGFVRGVVVSHDDVSLFSCGDDGVVKQWELAVMKPLPEMDMDEAADTGNLVTLSEVDVEAMGRRIMPVNQWKSETLLTSIDHHWADPFFVTTGDSVDIWDVTRSTPVHSFDWSQNADAVYTARFNPAERSLLAASGTDNSVGLIDLRTSSALQRIRLKTRTNALCWNPMKPLNFVLANDDHNLYTFDMRQLERALVVHKDFTNAVMDVDYSPTGHEFVAGSYDRTVRIYSAESGRSRDIYHGRRMQM